jgi:hypothetical protein
MMMRNRLSLTERRLMWEQGMGLEIRENTAAVTLMGFAAVLMVISMTSPVLQWFYLVTR